MSERDKKYLFVLDLSQGRGLPNKVTEAFMRKAFSTNSVLAVLTDVDKTSFDYINYTQRKIFGGGRLDLSSCRKIKLTLKTRCDKRIMLLQAVANMNCRF